MFEEDGLKQTALPLVAACAEQRVVVGGES